MRKSNALLLAIALTGSSACMACVECIPYAIAGIIKQALKEHPPLDTSDNLLGADNNNNGIRDDIDDYISTLSLTEHQKRATDNLAASLQSVLLLDLDDHEALSSHSKKSTLSVVCHSAAFDNVQKPYAYLQDLEKYTFNTRARSKLYGQYNSARSGSVTRLPSRKDCP